jgi:hypothetical protein
MFHQKDVIKRTATEQFKQAPAAPLPDVREQAGA